MAQTAAQRRAAAQNLIPFQKGQSGNPGGSKKGIARTVREIAGNDDGATIARLLWQAAATGYMPYVKAEADSEPRTTLEKVSVSERTTALQILLHRGWGKPPEYAPIEDGDPLDLTDEAATELAAELDKRIDELAQRRAARDEA